MQVNQISRYQENMDAVNVGKTQMQKSKNSADTFTASAAGMSAAFGMVYEKGSTLNMNAYRDADGKKDILSEALSFDPKNNKNYMAVMSNTMSDEDFAALMKDGKSPSNISPEETVTVMDEIKVTLARAGVYIPGYTDDLDDAAVKEIAGSMEGARAIENALKEKGVPATKENIEEINVAIQKADETAELTEGAIKYLIGNDHDLTIDNLHKAVFAGDKNGEELSGGYFNPGAEGYMAVKGDASDIADIEEQIKGVVERAGFDDGDEKVLSDAKWLVEKGLPLTEENLYKLEDIRSLKLPLKKEEAALLAADAISAGIKADNAEPLVKEGYLNKANDINEKTKAIDPSAVDGVLAENKKLTLKNLFEFSGNKNEDGTSGEKENKGRADLAKVQLMMSAQANLKLLRSGIKIELEPLDKLVSHFEKEEELFRSTELSNVMTKAEEVKELPAATIGLAIKEQWLLHGSFTIEHVHSSGEALKQTYIKAGESYETMMTAPRADLGDNIKEAFRNIEDILTEENLEPTEENKRAARILGYNTMEISRENIYEIKQASALLDKVVNELTPQRALTMIREGVNPLNMNLDELSDYLSSLKTSDEDISKYSTFLNKLDHDKEINADERDAYIGIYRLLRQIEKGDDSALGGVLKDGRQLNLANLMGAVRTGKKGYVDIKINESFGFLSEVERNGSSITDQIENYYKNRAASLLDELGRPEPMGSDNEAILKEEIDEMRRAFNAQEEVFAALAESDIKASAENIEAQQNLMTEGGFYERFLSAFDTKDRKQELKKLLDKLENAMSEGGEALRESLGEFAEEGLKAAEEAGFDSPVRLDAKAMALYSKQLSIISRHSLTENYYVPMEMGDHVGTVHVRFVKGSGDGSVEVRFPAGSVSEGEITATFKNYSERIDGVVVAENEADEGRFKEISERFSDILVEEFGKNADINCVRSKYVSSAISRSTDDRVSTKDLYRIAGRWIELISQEV